MATSETERTKAWAKANPERRREILRRSGQKKYARQRAAIVAARREFRAAAPLSYHLTNAKARAKLFGVPFEITASDVSVPVVCPLCGDAFEFGAGRNTRKSISIDRLIPSLGYTKANTWVICLDCNRAKGKSTPRLMAGALREMHSRGFVAPEVASFLYSTFAPEG